MRLDRYFIKLTEKSSLSDERTMALDIDVIESISDGDPYGRTTIRCRTGSMYAVAESVDEVMGLLLVAAATATSGDHA